MDGSTGAAETIELLMIENKKLYPKLCSIKVFLPSYRNHMRNFVKTQKSCGGSRLQLVS